MMNWLSSFLWSSIGKKLLMAVSGLCFCGFLATHLAGNLTLFKGKNAFVAYAESLHKLGPVITAAEWGLLILALIHVLTGITLFVQNLKARPSRYAVNRNAGGRTLGSKTMPYTGLILLIFVIVHLFNFHFVDRTDRSIFQIVSATFDNSGYVIFYIAVMIVAAVHVSHGFWSAFQTIGADHPKYTPIIKGLALVFSLVVAIGFGSLPIYISFYLSNIL